MRVLIVSNQYPPVIGGIEVLVAQLAGELQSHGHEVVVLTSTHRSAPDERSVTDGVVVHRNDLVRAIVRKDPLWVARCRKSARAVVAEFAPDVIHAHDPGPLLWAVAECGIPVLATVHVSFEPFERSQLGPISRQLAACDWVTAVSEAVSTEAQALIPELEGRLSVVINGVPIPPEAPPYTATRRVVGIGRIVAQKGFDILVRGFAKIVETDAVAELVIVGDGTLLAELQLLAAELRIAHRVRFTGALRHADLAEVLASAAVVAMPSRYEGMPLVALEAGAAARPVVSTSVHGLSDVISHRVTGLIVPQEDPAALAVAVSELFNDPVLAERLGRAGRERVVANHSLTAMTTAYEALYRRITPNR